MLRHDHIPSDYEFIFSSDSFECGFEESPALRASQIGKAVVATEG